MTSLTTSRHGRRVGQGLGRPRVLGCLTGLGPQPKLRSRRDRWRGSDSPASPPRPPLRCDTGRRGGGNLTQRAVGHADGGRGGDRTIAGTLSRRRFLGPARPGDTLPRPGAMPPIKRQGPRRVGKSPRTIKLLEVRPRCGDDQRIPNTTIEPLGHARPGEPAHGSRADDRYRSASGSAVQVNQRRSQDEDDPNKRSGVASSCRAASSRHPSGTNSLTAYSVALVSGDTRSERPSR